MTLDTIASIHDTITRLKKTIDNTRIDHIKAESLLGELVAQLETKFSRLQTENARLRAALVKIEHYSRDFYETPLDVIYEMKQIARTALEQPKGGPSA